MERNQSAEPLRRSPSTDLPPRQQEAPFVRKSSPPTLTLVNGSGEESTLSSPVVVDTYSDDDSLSSDIESPIPQVGHSKSVPMPVLFESSTTMNGNRTRDYSPAASFTGLSPPNRILSPSKMVIAAAEGKPRPVVPLDVFLCFDCRIIEGHII